MSYPFQIPLALYIIDIALALLAIHKKYSKLYIPTKTLLMPLLLATYLCLLTPQQMEANNQMYVVAALLFHTGGDALLLFPRTGKKIPFYLGMLSFFFGHMCYTVWFAKAQVGHTRILAILTFFLVAFAELLFLRQLMKGPRKYMPKLIPYSYGLAALAIAIASTFGNGSPAWASVVSMVGVILFCFSDYNIARRLVRMPLYGQMTTMTTYISGQSLIVLGMYLLQLTYKA